MTRPKLRQIPLSTVDLLRPGALTVTMSTDQWDGLLSAMYRAGAVLLELDDDERPVAAYQHPDAEQPGGAA